MGLDNKEFQIQFEDSFISLISENEVKPSTLKVDLNEIVIFCGAGISFEKPTNMPNIPEEIMKIAIDPLVNDKKDNQKGNSTLENPEDIQPMLDIMKQFRFEHFVEILSNYDKELICLNYLKEPPPNQNHLFLAELLNTYNVPIITTNLDSCIEKAFKILNKDSKPTILINKKDFKNFNDNKGNPPKNIICKLHGSVENYFDTNIDTKKSYGTTIKDFLKVWKDDKLIFLLPSYKRTCLEKIVNNKWLIFIGYSGQDTFDIEETMIDLKPKGIIWFQYYNTNDTLYEVKPLDKITRNFDEYTFQNRRYVDPNNRFREIRKFNYLSSQKKEFQHILH